MDRPWLEDGWKPVCKQDVVDLLMEVQTGHVSCRRASDILFPQFKVLHLTEDMEVRDSGEVGESHQTVNLAP